MNAGICIRSTSYAQSNEGDYYGMIQEIVQLQYPGLPEKSTILFKCEWFDPRSSESMKVHRKFKLVDINFKKRWPKYEPFVFAHQAIQVYYTPYPSMRHDKRDWWAVFPIKARETYDVPQVEHAYQDDHSTDLPFSIHDDPLEPLRDWNTEGDEGDIGDDSNDEVSENEIEYESEDERDDIDICANESDSE